ncbi:hypothetical protein ACQKDL_13025 [Pseudomonas bubulae]|uniref:hypothetical protein n=1 Tax=Pseudomonas bubulae TaxID=2316085 RepID=UPI003D0593D4
MTEQANRIDWLERQLAQVDQFIDRDTKALEEDPGRYSLQLALNSWRSHQDELHQELRQAKAALQKEVVQLRLLGDRMDGSIPLRLLSKLADKFNRAVTHAAYHLRHGTGPAKGIPEDMARDIDLRLSGLQFGSTRLMFAGNVSPDTTGESLMEGALEQIFDVLAAASQEKIRDLVAAIGVPATKALSELLSTLESASIGAELSWPAPNSRMYHWGGSLEAVRSAHNKLSAFETMHPQKASLRGTISDLKENGAVYIRNAEGKHKISYNRQQYQHIQQYQLGMDVNFKVMKYVRTEPLTEREITTYKLITED